MRKPCDDPMPYYIFKIAPPLTLSHLDTMDDYQSARALVRSLRERQEPGDPVQYRLMFANQQAEAERLLATPRDERVIGED